MNKEEKQAMKELRHYGNMTSYYKEKEYTDIQIGKYIDTVLNLISKQQKEIEKLIKTNKILFEQGQQNAIQELLSEKYIRKDKIREKIEFYKSYGKIKNSNEYVMSEGIEILQELLEE